MHSWCQTDPCHAKQPAESDLVGSSHSHAAPGSAASSVPQLVVSLHSLRGTVRKPVLLEKTLLPFLALFAGQSISMHPDWRHPPRKQTCMRCWWPSCHRAI